MNNRLFVLSLALAGGVFLSGCGILYTNIHVPRAYRSATPGEVSSDKNDEMVTGKSCYKSLLFLFAWGDAGYAKATEKALGGRTDVILYDVKTDMQVKSYLSLYTRICTHVTGKITKP